MGEQFLGEIRLFSSSRIPQGWLACNGQVLQIVQYKALFSLLSNRYGGDGRTTFALPNLQGRVPVHFTNTIGTQGGEANHTLTQQELPEHTHTVKASINAASATSPSGNTWANVSNIYKAATSSVVQMNGQALSIAGGSQAHNNMQPFVALSFCIATIGYYPPRD